MIRLSILWFGVLVLIIGNSRMCDAQDEDNMQIYRVALKSRAQLNEADIPKKLSSELAATLDGSGILLGRTDDGMFVISSPRIHEQALRESPVVRSVDRNSPREYQAITRLRLSYTPPDKPTKKDLEEMGLELVEDYAKGTFLIVRTKRGIVASVISKLRANSTVRFATTVYKAKVTGPAPVESKAKISGKNIGTPTNDPDWDKLWGMRDIGVTTAWKKTTRTPLIVAVLDYSHPDISCNVWNNSADPKNGKDDDGNGLVDDVHGADFANNDGDPMDDNGHGTHCAGIVGAIGNNRIGAVGVNWSVQLISTVTDFS